MNDFDKDCPRCHGKGIATPTAPVQVPASAPNAVFVPNATQQANADAAAQKNTQNCMAAGCGCPILLIVALFAFSWLSNIGNPEAGKEGKTSAYVLAKMSIERQLKSPSTAKFPYSSAPGVSVLQQGDEFYISSYVDAQNSFGALLRKKWVAHARRNSDGKDMRLIEAKLLE